MECDYEPPLDELLTLGEVNLQGKWNDYAQLGVCEEHIPELVRMATDRKLHRADSESSQVWAPVHAWRALGQLRALDVVAPLLELLEELEDDDYLHEETPVVAGMVGQPAIASLKEFLADHRHSLFPRIGAAHGLAEVAQQHGECRTECVAALTDQLRIFPQNNPTLNGYLISFLVELEADESAAEMEAAFAAEKVDLSIVGDWEDAQIKLGLLTQRLTARPDYHGDWDELPVRKEQISAATFKKRKEKEKRKKKMAQKSRKKNRKKR